jgi:hypothetical protein
MITDAGEHPVHYGQLGLRRNSPLAQEESTPMETAARRRPAQDACEQLGIPKTKIKFWFQTGTVPVPHRDKIAWLKQWV